MTGQGWREAPMALARPGPAGWLRLVWRGPLLAATVYGGLIVLLALRLVEAPLCGLRRPVTPFVTQGVCRLALRLLGLRLVVRGLPMAHEGAIVANHGSWLDIFVLNAVDRVFFVSKSEVAGWPGIGWLARATGTVFIARRGVEARAQQDVFEARLRAGHRLLFFPEGTSTDTRRVLPFKSTLFAAFLAPDLRERIAIQPATVIYHAPPGRDPRFLGWWGDMAFAPHLLAVLAAPRGGRVEVVLHAPAPVSAFADRKALARWAEGRVRAAHPAGGVALTDQVSAVGAR